MWEARCASTWPAGMAACAVVGAQCSRHSNTHQISRDSRKVTGSSGFWGSCTCELTLLLSNLEFNVKIAMEPRSALTHSPGEQSNARSSPRLSQAIDLRRHAQALCNCLHEADLRCQLGYQISKDFPLGAAKMGNQRQFHAKQSSLPRHVIDQLGVRQFILA